MSKKKRNRQTTRLIFQAAFFALTNGYARGFAKGKIYTGANKMLCVPGLNCYSCPGAMGSCPLGSLQSVLSDRGFTFSCYVFGVIMAFGALFGRLICGWMCPFGLFQDLLHKIPLFKKTKRLPGHKWLKYTKYVVLIVFVVLLPSVVADVTGAGSPWFCEYICPSGTLLGGIPLTIANTSLRSAIGFRFWWKVIVLVALTILSIKVYRPFCKYLCPLGALYGAANPISFYRLRVNKDACVGCGACQKACGMDIPVWQQPNSMECIRCGKCKQVCPQHAITSTWEDWGCTILKKTRPSAENNDTTQGVYTEKQAKTRKTLATLMHILQYPILLVLLFIAFYYLMMGDQESITVLTVLERMIAFYVGLCGCFGMIKASGWLKKSAAVRARNGEICGTVIFSVLLQAVSLVVASALYLPKIMMTGMLIGAAVNVLLCVFTLFACKKEKVEKTVTPD